MVNWDTEGTKYHPLFERLLFSGQNRIVMSFSEIEDVIGTRLAPSARRRAEWWSNSPIGHSQARAWMRASYKASAVDLSGETVVFTLEGWPEGYRKVKLGSLPSGSSAMGFGEAAQAGYDASEHDEGEHPLFGIWMGKVTLVPGHDYTMPAFEPDATP